MKKLTSRLFGLIIILSLLLSNTVFAAELNGKYISASGACLLDYNTGEILYSYNGDIARAPASMTKIMTAYCVYDAIARGEISYNTIVPISKRVYDMARNPDYQCVPLNYNANYTVDELLGVMITYSPIAPAVALAEVVSGSEAKFVERMNNKVRELGIAAYFYDASGLAKNEITPVAMAQLSASIIKNYPDIITRTSKRYVTFRGVKYNSTNKLYTSFNYPGADGLKTGTTNASGYCFCGTAQRDGQRFIAVAMGSTSATQRFSDVVAMLDYGFENAKNRLGTLQYTGLRTYIDNFEVPTFVHTGSGNRVVLVEDLTNYGFDIDFNPVTKTVTATRNRWKGSTPIPMDYYRAHEGEVAYNVINNNVSVIIMDNGIAKPLTTLYNVNGYIGINVDELGAMYTKSSNVYNNITYIDTSEAIPQAAEEETAPEIDPYTQALNEAYYGL